MTKVTWRDAAIRRLVAQCAPQEHSDEGEELWLEQEAHKVLAKLDRVAVEREWAGLLEIMRSHPVAMSINERAQEHERECDNDLKRLMNEGLIGDAATVPEPVESHVSIVKPPGQLLVLLASLMSKKQPLRLIINQSIADMRDEHYEALAAGNRKTADWIAVRGNVSTLLAALTYLGFWAILGRAMKMWKGE